MGLFDFFLRRKPGVAVAVGADDPDPSLSGISYSDSITGTFLNENVTYRGELAGLDYDRLIRDPQNWQNYVTICKLANLFVIRDPLFRGIVKEVYTAFTTADDWILVGSDERTKKKYQDHYNRIDLKGFFRSVAYQYWLYGNVICYLMNDGSLITMPFNMVRLGGVTIDGEPIVEYHCRAIQTDFDRIVHTTLRQYVDDDQLKTRLKGLPEEVVDGLLHSAEWVQLDPSRTFVMQDIKEEWSRYAIPLVATCLSSFRKKELISRWEDAQLNLGAHSFLHIKYGDPKDKVLPDNEALTLIGATFKTAMKKSGIAVTDCWADPKFHQPDLDELFSDDKYKSVNAEILDAGGISGIIVSGRAEDGSTFASAQVSMQTAAMRIKACRDQFCKMMDKINRRINMTIPTFPHGSEDRIPRFTFPPTDLTGNTNFLKTCETLYAKGMLSNETYLSAYKFDFNQEVERKKREKTNGIADLFNPNQSTVVNNASNDNARNANNTNSNENENANGNNQDDGMSNAPRGRPTLDDSERHSDPSKSITGRQPKGSNPAGSEAQT